MSVDTSLEYLETQVLTASPHRLHLLVVDGALRFAKQGLAAFERDDWETVDLALARSRDCVSELIGGLSDRGPTDVIATQKSLFAFVFRSLALADPQRNAQHIHDAIRILELHRETWVALADELSATTAATESVPAPHSRSWTT